MNTSKGEIVLALEYENLLRIKQKNDKLKVVADELSLSDKKSSEQILSIIGE